MVCAGGIGGDVIIIGGNSIYSATVSSRRRECGNWKSCEACQAVTKKRGALLQKCLWLRVSESEGGPSSGLFMVGGGHREHSADDAIAKVVFSALDSSRPDMGVPSSCDLMSVFFIIHLSAVMLSVARYAFSSIIGALLSSAISSLL